MIPEELAKQIKLLEIRTDRMVEEISGGAYRSVFKGAGIEFEEVREYTIEDDVRTIDWNVSARMGTPYVKKFVEERELNVMLLVDVSASGAFGSAAVTKRRSAAELAALIAPRKLLVSNGEVDDLFLIQGTKEVYSVIEKIYEKEGVKENCRLVVFPDKPHYFDKESVFGNLKDMREKK